MGITKTLPDPRHSGFTDLEYILSERRSYRVFEDKPMSILKVSRLLWAAVGVNSKNPERRVMPSAGAIYPITAYLQVNNVTDLSQGIYRYNPTNHELDEISVMDCRAELFHSCLKQPWVGMASINIALSVASSKMKKKYGDRGLRYILMEAGHIGQNIYLQAASLGLGTVAIGAFHDARVNDIFKCDGKEESIVYILPVGYKK